LIEVLEAEASWAVCTSNPVVSHVAPKLLNEHGLELIILREILKQVAELSVVGEVLRRIPADLGLEYRVGPNGAELA